MEYTTNKNILQKLKEQLEVPSPDIQQIIMALNFAFHNNIISVNTLAQAEIMINEYNKKKQQ